MEVSSKYKILEEIKDRHDDYFFIHENKYGLRFGEPKDAGVISQLYVQEYGFEYVNPVVYHLEALKEKIANEKNFWIIGEVINSKELFVVSLIEFLKPHIAYPGKTIL